MIDAVAVRVILLPVCRIGKLVVLIRASSPAKQVTKMLNSDEPEV